ncbi:uncharacterized protein LOC106011078 [Aplysia californica]|uniref:Uncharacterized protein LOC106011078 n=1 Tax=Aplysia californica TaxID=6500 RepID=A0ABM0ZUT2_APLCA|nr:uncharacterized protein LOC106011078 [Aplysia californica]
MRSLSVVICLLLAVTGSLCENLQLWSSQSKEGVNFSLDCMPTDLGREPNVTSVHRLRWYKKGESGQLTTNDHYTIQEKGGVAGAELVFTPVTPTSAGIYFCQVSNATDHLGTVVKGLNIGGRLYEDYMDKYRTSVIIGIITGGSVLFLVLAVCFIDHFRFLTPEQKQKRRDRKEERLARQARLHNGGLDNNGLDMSEDVTRATHEVNGEQKQANTHL